MALNSQNYNQSKTLSSAPLLANTLPPLLPTPTSKANQSVNQSLNKGATSIRNSSYIPTDIRAEKITKGLCYYCDQTYERGHKCKFKEPRLFTVEVPRECIELVYENNEPDERVLVEEIEPCISVNALAWNQNFQTMSLKGLVVNNLVHILVDSGSTHNFLDLSFSKKLGLQLEEVSAQAVTIIDGNHIVCKYICRNFSWLMSGRKFSTEVILIPLESCDMVLGIPWLTTIGPVYWDFKKLRMNFIIDDEQISLKVFLRRRLKY